MKHIPIQPFTDVCALDVGSIMQEIVHEASSSCSDVRSTFQHFARLKCENGCAGCEKDEVLGEVILAECFGPEEIIYLSAVTGSLNFAGIREQYDNWTRHEFVMEADRG